MKPVLDFYLAHPEWLTPSLVLLEISALCLAALLASRFNRNDASVRYGIGVATLIVIWLTIPLTILVQKLGLTSWAYTEMIQASPVYEWVEVAAAPVRTEPNWLLLTWIAGSIFGAARLVHGAHKVWQLKRNAFPLSDDVYVTDELSGPVVVGPLQPAILVPRKVLMGLSEEELADVLAHEYAHVSKRHLLVAVFQRITAAILWPHPLIHLLNRVVSDAREEICDNVVLKTAGPARYARVLLRVAECRQNRPHVASALGLFGPKTHLEKRVKSLLDPNRRITTEMNTRKLALAALALTFAVGAIGAARIDMEIVPANAAPDPAQIAPVATGITAPEPLEVTATGKVQGKTRAGSPAVLKVYVKDGKATAKVIKAPKGTKSVTIETKAVRAPQAMAGAPVMESTVAPAAIAGTPSAGPQVAPAAPPSARAGAPTTTPAPSIAPTPAPAGAPTTAPALGAAISVSGPAHAAPSLAPQSSKTRTLVIEGKDGKKQTIVIVGDDIDVQKTATGYTIAGKEKGRQVRYQIATAQEAKSISLSSGVKLQVVEKPNLKFKVVESSPVTITSKNSKGTVTTVKAGEGKPQIILGSGGKVETIGISKEPNIVYFKTSPSSAQSKGTWERATVSSGKIQYYRVWDGKGNWKIVTPKGAKGAFYKVSSGNVVWRTELSKTKSGDIYWKVAPSKGKTESTKKKG